MNVFEDLIEELKEENLLEETVIETKSEKNGKDTYEVLPPESVSILSNSENITTNSIDQNHYPELENIQNFGDVDTISHNTVIDDEFSAAEAFLLNNHNLTLEDEIQSPQNEDVSEEKLQESLIERNNDFSAAADPNEVQQNKQIISEKEFFQKRAMEEVTGLQMVEFVLSGVEREQMKVVSLAYDDLGVKKALHTFMQISEDVHSPEHAQAEFSLMQETENWCSALSHRDRRISVAHLRRFCETTRPVLSTQALISLARFYRNLPFSESVRSKFDLVVSRLFSKETEYEKRELFFTREELTGHLKELYAEWSSIQLYSNEDNDDEIVIATKTFEDFMNEAARADSFGDLVKQDFFNRLREFKEKTQELFYAPAVAATAIECNIFIGNIYVDLIENERSRTNVDELQEKYGFIHDQSISDATSKTLQLVELLKEREIKVEVRPETENQQAKKKDKKADESYKTENVFSFSKRKGKALFGINKWLLMTTVFVVLLCGGLFVYVEFLAEDLQMSPTVKKVELEGKSYKEFIQTARISDNTFYGVTLPGWDSLPEEKRTGEINKILQDTRSSAVKTIHLLNQKGKTVAFATPEKIEFKN